MPPLTRDEVLKLHESGKLDALIDRAQRMASYCEGSNINVRVAVELRVALDDITLSLREMRKS